MRLVAAAGRGSGGVGAVGTGRAPLTRLTHLLPIQSCVAAAAEMRAEICLDTVYIFLH